MKNGLSPIRRSGLDRRELPPERDPRLRLVDAVLNDLTTRSAMYVGRRLEDGDADTFVIQTGSEGRFQLSLPDLNSDASIEAVVAEAQAHLSTSLACRCRCARGTCTRFAASRSVESSRGHALRGNGSARSATTRSGRGRSWT